MDFYSIPSVNYVIVRALVCHTKITFVYILAEEVDQCMECFKPYENEGKVIYLIFIFLMEKAARFRSSIHILEEQHFRKLSFDMIT